MTLVSGRLGRTLAVGAAACAVAATLTMSPSATAVEPDGPHYQEPSVGQCRNYTITAAYKESNSTPTTPCSSTHTAKVIAVGQLPDGVTWSSSTAQIGAAVSKKCAPAFDTALGGTEKLRRMSAYTLWWFAPTQAQKDHGARWFRCDVALIGHGSLIPLPSNSNPLLRDGKLTYGVTLCLYGDRHLYTACARSHNHRATGGFVFSGSTYPGDAVIKNTVARRCPNLTSSRTWLYTAPSRESWRHGDRIAICFSKTSH